MPEQIGIGRCFSIQNLTGTSSTVAPISFLAQSRFGPGLYAVFPAHLLDQTNYPKAMWAFEHNFLGGALPPKEEPDVPPTAGPTMGWPVKTPQQSAPLKTQRVPVNQNKNKDQDPAWNVQDLPIPLTANAAVLGPVVYRSGYRGAGSFIAADAWALSEIDLAVAFLNENSVIPKDAFQLPGQAFGIPPGSAPLTLTKAQSVRVCAEFLWKPAPVEATISQVDASGNGRYFEIRPKPGQPALQAGYSGGPVMSDPTDGSPPIFLGYVIQGGDDHAIVLRADAVMQHLNTFCPGLGLSIATDHPDSVKVWSAGSGVNSPFYQGWKVS
jgi:hypothetical protein